MTKYAYRIESRMIREADFPYHGQALCDPRAVAAFLSPLLERDRENMVVLYLNTKNKLIGLSIQEGTIDRSVIYPREIVKAALLSGANAVVLAHNHPSGEPEPSPEDRALTEAILSALKTVNIRLLDHVVIGTSTYCSFFERRLISHE